MKNKKFIRLVVTALIVFLICTLLEITGLFSFAEQKSYDARMKASADFFAPSEEIALVLLDQESLDWARAQNGWGYPWPRSAYGDLVSFFNRGHAASVAFDMLYTEPSLYGNADDEAFAESSREFGRVVQTVYLATANGNPLKPVDSIADGAAVLGNVTSTPDSDGSVRRSGFYSDTTPPYPGLATASLSFGDHGIDIDEIPRAKDGGMYVRFQKDLSRFAPYSASTILKSEYAVRNAEKNGTTPDFSGDLIDPAQFEGMHIFFGLYAPGLFDICANPISEVYPGVGVHVCQLDTMLNESFLKDSPLPLSLLIIAAAVILGCLIGGVSKQANSKSIIIEVVLFLAVGILYAAATFLLFIPGTILPFTVPLFALMISFVITVFETYLSEGKERRFIKAAFSQYLSPTVIDILIENPKTLKLGGERRNITAFFSDIQGFTSISEKMSPEEMTSFLNTYLNEMSAIILSHGGTIDKYEGDAIIAFWNAPTDQEDHAKRGLEAALECQKRLREMQGKLMQITGKPILQRIGLNSGIATVGNFGSSNRFDYTMMGDTVNLASRLEGINKQFGTYTCCSESTMEEAKKNGSTLYFRRIGNIAVVGRKDPVKIFLPMTQDEADANRELLSEFEKGYNEFCGGRFSEALRIFSALSDKDPVSAKYCAKCSRLMENPPQEWKGYEQATEK